MFGSSIVALITPFDPEGRLDLSSFENLILWHLEQGTEALVLGGSTGEGSTLTKEEKCILFQTAHSLVNGRMALIANTGSNITAESVSLTYQAKNLGMDGALAIVPYYNKPTEEGVYCHFEKIAGVGLPLILYHHSGRTGIKLSLECLVKICGLPQVVGIKDAVGDLSLAIDLLKEKICLYSGDDPLALAQFSLGYTGSISVVGNVLPADWRRFIDFAKKNDFIKAREEFYALCGLLKAIGLEVNPQCIKYAVSLLGKCLPTMRLPLLEPKEENKAKIKKALEGTLQLLLN